MFQGVHRSERFCVVIAEKGGQTDAARMAFLRYDVEDWERPDPPSLPLQRDDIHRLRPDSLALLELTSQRELDLCKKLYGDNPLLSQERGPERGVELSQELNTSTDSRLSPGHEMACYGICG